jgi:hypothetical protein
MVLYYNENGCRNLFSVTELSSSTESEKTVSVMVTLSDLQLISISLNTVAMK